MEQIKDGLIKDGLIKGKTILGKWYVRPITWAGVWKKDEETEDTYLVSGNTLITSDSELDCDIYIEAHKESKSKHDYSGINECITDNEKLKQLIAENPELPIMYMCGEECYCDDFGYTINTGSYSIEEVTLVDDMICDDKDDLGEKIYCKLDNEYPNASKELIEILLKEELEKYVWKKVITVRLG